jgi:hypothetical protein
MRCSNSPLVNTATIARETAAIADAYLAFSFPSWTSSSAFFSRSYTFTRRGGTSPRSRTRFALFWPPRLRASALSLALLGSGAKQ